MVKQIWRERALEIIEGFAQAKVLVVGDFMVDHFIWGRVTRISPEAPVPVVDVQSDNFMLGGSGNVVNNIYTLGAKVYGAGVIGNDDMGQRVLEEFERRGIDTGGMVVEYGRPTTLKTRIIAHNQQVVRFDREERKPISPESIKKIVSYVAKHRDEVGTIVISDYNKGVINKTLLDGVREVIKGSDILVCVDPKQNDFSLYNGFDIITPNHHEAGRAAGIDILDGKDVVRVGKLLLDRYSFKALLITCGEEGMNLFEKDGETTHTFLAAEAREVYDVTGAGDTVIGVFALSLASGATFQEAAFLANHAAGIVVGKVGTATVTLDELKRVL